MGQRKRATCPLGAQATGPCSLRTLATFAAVIDRRYSRKMIVRARIVVTMDGAPIPDGAVRVSGNRIADVGKFSDVASANDEIVDLGERVLLPGLINVHCHLDYTCLRGKIPRQTSFTNWIRNINAEKEKLTAEDYVASINAGFAEAQRFGTTTIANLTAFPELIAEIETPIRTWWFAELIDVREPECVNEIVESAIESLQANKNWGLAPHAPFTASGSLFQRCQEVALRKNILLTTHLAESAEEMEMFRDRSGRLYQLLKEVGRDMTDCGHETPLQLFLRELSFPQRDPSVRAGRVVSLGMTGRWIIAHLNELTESDFDSLAEIQQKFSIVHCPRSHAYFGHAAFQFERLQRLGFNICLGTDSLASNDDLSLFAEMRAFQKKFPAVEPEEILEMVTVGPAQALNREHEFGKIRKNFLADIIAIPFRESSAVYETILNFVGKVPWIMLQGKITDTP
jgi:cytosine/adenosine deaminase-related metal-dependent hydrolase